MWQISCISIKTVPMLPENMKFLLKKIFRPSFGDKFFQPFFWSSVRHDHLLLLIRRSSFHQHLLQFFFIDPATITITISASSDPATITTTSFVFSDPATATFSPSLSQIRPPPPILSLSFKGYPPPLFSLFFSNQIRQPSLI